MVRAKEIKDKNHIKEILDNLKPLNDYLDTLDESGIEYEELCETVQNQFYEILEFLNISSQTRYFVELMRMWDYLRYDDYEFEQLMNDLD